MNYRLVTGPATEPLTYSEVKAFLRLNDDSEQTFVTTLITIARQIVEGQTWRPLISQSWALQFDASELNLFISNSSFKYKFLLKSAVFSPENLFNSLNE